MPPTSRPVPVPRAGSTGASSAATPFVWSPPSRRGALVWRWAREAETPVADAAQSTIVEWTLTRVAADRTRLELYEWGFVDPAHHRGNSEGWDEELAELRALAEA